MQQEELLKKVRLVTIVFAAVYILMGIAMIAFQLQFKSVLGIVLGIAACAFGAFRLFTYFKKSRNETLIATDLFIGTVFLLLGIICLVKHSVVLDFVELVFGLMLFAGALIKIQNAIDLHHLGYQNWWIVLIFGCVSVVFSVLVILKPDFVLSIYMTIAGVFLIYDGAANLASVFFYNTVAGRIKKGLDPNPAPKPKKEEPADPGGPGNGGPAEGGAYHDPSYQAPPASPFQAPSEPTYQAPPAQNVPKFDPETGEPLQK